MEIYGLYDAEIYNLSELEVQDQLPKHIRMKSQVLNYLRTYPVENYQKGMLYVDGEFVKVLDPGVYQYWKSEKLALVKCIDTRLQVMEVGGQELLTKDKAGIRVNFTLQYQVNDVRKALINTKEFEKQLYLLMQLALREHVGTMNLDQLLANKETVGDTVLKSTSESAEQLGVKLIHAGIKDIILPGDVKDIMNQVLIAQKKAQANTIMRQEETASTRSLLNTAKLMEQNTMLMKLKEMEYMEKIAEKVGEISVNGKGRVMDQLTELLVSAKT